MNLLLVLWIFGIALTFFVVFLLADSLNKKEKIMLALELIAFLSLILVGAYFIESYIN